jgi:hypothetical protein
MHLVAVVWLGSSACNQVTTDPYSTYTGYPNTSVAGDTTDDTATAGTGSETTTGGAPTSGESGIADDSTGSDATAGTSGDCVLGSEGCPCTMGGGCDLGLSCLSTVCVDPGALCPVGSQGCPCTPEAACDEGLVCLANECVVDE